MENLKFIFGSLIGIGILVLLGYWAVNSLESGKIHVDKQVQKELREENERLLKEVEDLKNELRQYEDIGTEIPAGPGAPVVTPTTPEPTPPITSTPLKHQELINQLQDLIDDKIMMKEKSRGTRVGTVQNFLNIYNGTTKKVDNDYGKTTKADVTAFQKAVGLTADGEAGPSTFQKMIDWLKSQ